MPHEGAESVDWRDGPRLIMTGPICRAAPTRIAPRGRGAARSRRWLIVGAIAVAALLGGASAALASADTSPTHPVHAAARPNHAKSAHALAAAPAWDNYAR
jgi:hypothetical protein